MNHTIALLLVLVTSLSYGQFKTVQDSPDYMEKYGEYFDRKYEKGNVLIVRKKGKTIDPSKSWKPTKKWLHDANGRLMIWNLPTECATEPEY